MRVFKKYAPRQIAKYVCDFFKGSFSIDGVGIFIFDKGRVVASNETDIKKLTICKEINLAARSMSVHLQS